MNEHANMKSIELIDISESILATRSKSADYYSNMDLYAKVKAEFISYFKNEAVAKYAFEAKRSEWDECTYDAGVDHLRAVLANFNRDSSDTENLLDLLITLIVWCKTTGCEF